MAQRPGGGNQQQNADPIPNHPRYETVRFLGKGAYGSVILARDKVKDRLLALKLMSPSLATSKYTEREITNQLKLCHGHVVKLEGIFVSGGYLVVVMEYADMGDLQNYITSRRDRLPEAEVRWIFQQLMMAVDFCHRMGVVNRDIKMENILLFSGKRIIAKLADFGFSKDETVHSKPTSRLGTIMYIAPEVVTNTVDHTYDARKTDIWSCGVVLYCMMTASFPFERPGDALQGRFKEMQNVTRRILKGEFTTPPQMAPDCAALVQGMLTVDPTQRYSTKDIFENPWFSKGLKPGVLQYNDKLVEQNIAHPSVNEEKVQQIRMVLAEAAALQALKVAERNAPGSVVGDNSNELRA